MKGIQQQGVEDQSLPSHESYTTIDLYTTLLLQYPRWHVTPFQIDGWRELHLDRGPQLL